MAMTKSEAGKLGAAASRKIVKEQKNDRIQRYQKNPSKCKLCESALEYNHRTKSFCNSSCAAKYNNQRRTKKTGKHCIQCKTAPAGKKYCSTFCQHEYQYKRALEKWFETGIAGKGVIGRYLRERYGNCCSVCNINEWNGQLIVFELEHKDGNSTNNTPENVCLICPNCHSQTSTYKGRNRGNGRHSRRIRYQEGKSY